ncbi:potassium channel family protein [Palaeococcus ferrophilus]|uniref:potassium channel family protein n=1 Tax=Palaeococcus ferrophilus TaxID=83868 RepID=UPI00064FD41C|nr:potassium channel family protein [Palaeococcus ferrophilus]
MCEYAYRNGRKCRKRPLEGSKFCPLHIPYEEGEALFGEKIREIKREAFLKELKRGRRYFEGVYLYDVELEELEGKTLVFRNSHIEDLRVREASIKGITIYDSTLRSLTLIKSELDTVFIRNSTIFAVNLLEVGFSGNIMVRDSEIKYVMMNAFEFKQKSRERAEEYGENVRGRVELSRVSGLRKVAINSKYPLLKELTGGEELKRRSKATALLMSGLEFEESPRFKRSVRILIRNYHGALTLEGIRVLGHVQISGGRIHYPEFVHVTIHGNLVARSSRFVSDPMWNLTTLANLVVELNVTGYILLENCSFSNPGLAETFYRLARTSWEKNGDKERADEYYYLEMLARRRSKYGKLGARVEFPVPRFRIPLPRRVRRFVHGLEVLFEWLFADLTCKYGTDWRRPILLWLLMVNVVFPTLFYAVKGVGAKSFWDYQYFSIVTATTLGYGDLHPIGLGKAIASAEALFGMFMWAVFLTVFARKYMR